jgi:hypothetical protein
MALEEATKDARELLKRAAIRTAELFRASV